MQSVRSTPARTGTVRGNAGRPALTRGPHSAHVLALGLPDAPEAGRKGVKVVRIEDLDEVHEPEGLISHLGHEERLP